MAPTLSLLLLASLAAAAAADLCPEPVIPNGGVAGRKADNFFMGQVRCDRGYQRIGNPRIKCRGGVWSGPLPVCTVLGACPSIDIPTNGRAIPVRGSRGSAFRFGCNRDFHLLGEKVSYCVDDTWSHDKLPVCARNTCDQSSMHDIPYGEALSMLGGALYRYRCNEGLAMHGSSSLYCDGESWNSTKPTCLLAPAAPTVELLVDGHITSTVRPGDLALITCHAKTGNPVPEVQISFAGETSDSMNYKSSMTVTVPEGQEELEVSCTASNMAGEETETIPVTVLSPPSSAVLTGPSSLLRNSEHSFGCRVEGGNPAPQVTWTVVDEEGERKEKGEEGEEGQATFTLLTKDTNKMVAVTCTAENGEGQAEDSLHLPVHYLPSTVEVSGPTSATSGDLVTLTCTASTAFPAPALEWRVHPAEMAEAMAEGFTVLEEMEDGAVVATSELSLTPTAGLLSVECLARTEGLGETRSLGHEVVVVDTTTTTTTTEETTTKTEASTTTTEEATTKSTEAPVLFGLRPGTVVAPGHLLTLTCTAEVGQEGAITWMEGDKRRSEDAEEHMLAGKLVSSLEIEAEEGETTVTCFVTGQEERTASIVVEAREGVEGVTLANEYDEEDEEYYTEEDYEGDATADNAADAIAAFAATDVEEQVFSQPEVKAEVKDAGLKETKEMGVSAKFNHVAARFSNSSTGLLPSLLLVVAAALKHLW